MKIYTTAELQEKEEIDLVLKKLGKGKAAQYFGVCWKTLDNRMKYLDIVYEARKNSGRKRKVFHFNTINTK